MSEQSPPRQGEVLPAKRDIRVVEDNSPLAFLLDTARFEHLQRIALSMAPATFLPKHLRGATKEETSANCLRVVKQAMRWGMDPDAVADETYVVHGRLGFQGKLVIAVINSRAGLEGRLKFTYSGQGLQRTVTVSGKFPDETEPRTVTLSVEQGKTDNKMWTMDPDQKLAYSGGTKWARRHAPEVLLGIQTEDDLERWAQTQVGDAATIAEQKLRGLVNGSPKQPDPSPDADIEMQPPPPPGSEAHSAEAEKAAKEFKEGMAHPGRIMDSGRRPKRADSL